MDHGKFGPPIDSSSSDDDRFGYFGASAAPPLPAPVSQLGGSAPSADRLAGAPTNPFGGPSTYAASPTGGPSPYAAPAGYSPSKRRTPKAVVALVVLLMLGAGYYGWSVYQRSRAVDMPATFAGLPPNLDPAAQSATQSTMQSLQARNPGIKMNAQIYGTGTQAIILAAVRAREDVAADLHGAGIGPEQQIGGNTCAQVTGRTYVTCVRSEQNLTVVVMTFSGAPEATSSLLDQAWGQF